MADIKMGVAVPQSIMRRPLHPGLPQGEALVHQKSGERVLWSKIRQVVPILEWLPKYPIRQNFVPDLCGGLTLGCVMVAESLAHAELSKVHLINGPYSCMLAPMIYAVFGTCVHASVGTGGLVSLLTGLQLLQYGGDVDYRTKVGAILTLEVGAFLALMGICQLGFIVRFLSKPALSGFITGSALLIIFSQVAPMLGLPVYAQKGGIVEIVTQHTVYLELVNFPTLIMSMIALVFLLNGKKLKEVRGLKFLGDFKELLVLVVFAVFCSFYAEELGISVVGKVPEGMLSFDLPVKSNADIMLAKELWPGAALIALVVFLSSFAGAKKFAMKDGYQVKASNELVALGLANAIGAFNGAIPTQIGLSRTGIAYGAGVKSQLGADVFAAVVLMLVVRFFSGYLYFVPKCVLNAIIINGASHLTDFAEAKRLMKFAGLSSYDWKCRLDIVIWLAGFLCTLYFGAFKGILAAVGLSLLFVIYQVVNPNIHELGYIAHTENTGRPRKWQSRLSTCSTDFQNLGEVPNVLVFRIEGTLFYANIDRFQEWLDDREVQLEEEFSEYGAPRKIDGVILAAGAIPFVDSTAIAVLADLVRSHHDMGILFFVANTFGYVSQMIRDNLQESMVNGLHAELLEEARNATSIDDYVNIIGKNVRQNLERRQQMRRTSLVRASVAQFRENVTDLRCQEEQPKENGYRRLLGADLLVPLKIQSGNDP